MRFSTSTLGAILGLSAIAQAFNRDAIQAFKRPDKFKKHLDKRGPPVPAAESQPLVKRHSKFLNANSEKFVVNGSAIPEVNFDIGESYAGLLPISQAANEERQLYFWFFPTTNPDAGDEVAIWFTGGPGCSSLSTLIPVPNSYSWSNLTNMIFVEQPVGVGYAQGTPNITNEVELGLEFIGFWRNFIETFGMQGYTTYITGESYGGFYVPYVADAFITAADDTYYKLGGVAINDPILGDGTMQQQAVIMPFVEYWKELFYLNESYYNALIGTHEYCNYSSYIDQYLTFPPQSGPIPVLPDPYADNGGPDGNYTCDVFDLVYAAVLEINPCFNIYHITETCPHPYSQLGIINPGDYDPAGSQVYFNRTDVQAAINAPVGTHWFQCSEINVFGNGDDMNFSIGDTSLGPAQNGVLQRVIEHTNNTIIGVGNLDYILPSNGTLFALQNVTWNGMQGFQQYPQDQEFYVPYHPEYNGGRLSEAGYVGKWGYERGVTFYTVQLAGHELPGYAAGAGYRVLELLLGRIKDLGVVEDFSTQMGDFGNNATMMMM